MWSKSIWIAGKVLLPVALHYLSTNIIHMMRLHADAASLTMMAAIPVLPVFVYMMKQDEEARGYRTWKRLTGKQTGMLIFGAILCNMIFSFLMTTLMEKLGLSNEIQESLFQSNPVAQFLGIGCLIPIMEEVLFRGLVYQRLKDYNVGWLPVVLAAGIFAVYHGNAVQILFAFPMALIIIESYERTESIYGPILFHMTVNISSVLIAAYL